MKKIFLVMLALLTITGCDFNKEENKKTELSVDSEIVKNIVNTFQIKENTKSVEGNFEKFDEYKFEIAIKESNSSVKEETNCNHDMFKDNDPQLGYNCEYISYDDLNNTYKKLFDEELPKEDLAVIGNSVMLKYDNDKNIFRFTELMMGGGDFDKISIIVKAYSDNENIYIYERCFLDLHREFISFPHVKDSLSRIEVNIGDYEEFKKLYIDNFDLYKWTFKKNPDGTYTYKSVEYITEEF